MSARAVISGSALDPLSFALDVAEEYAGKATKPFTEAELGEVLRTRGLGFEGEAPPAPGSPEATARGTFVAKVALDYLYARRSLKRNMNARGDYVYSR